MIRYRKSFFHIERNKILALYILAKVAKKGFGKVIISNAFLKSHFNKKRIHESLAESLVNIMEPYFKKVYYTSFGGSREIVIHTNNKDNQNQTLTLDTLEANKM